MGGKKPTIDDVAALAGVARVTVSRVLNGNPNVRDSVRDRVFKAVEMLGYTVNMQARSLAGGRMHVLALVVESDVESEPNSYYQSGLELGALRACTEAGIQLVVQTVSERAAEGRAKILGLVAARGCEGLILTPPFSDDLELIDSLNSLGFPVSCISPGRAASTRANGVRIDEESAGHELALHLLGLGHRRFGYLRGLAGHLSAEDRFKGFKRALAGAGLDPSAYRAEQGNFTFRSGVELAQALLTADDRPTALVCANDDMAVGALFSAHRIGLDIPGDVSIVGFDDTPISEIIWPPLTTIHHPIKTLGYTAARMLVERIKGGGNDPRTEIVPHRLVVRDTSGPAGPLRQQ